MNYFETLIRFADLNLESAPQNNPKTMKEINFYNSLTGFRAEQELTINSQTGFVNIEVTKLDGLYYITCFTNLSSENNIHITRMIECSLKNIMSEERQRNKFYPGFQSMSNLRTPAY